MNLFEFRPVQAAYTENYVNSPEMFLAVRRGIYELGTFDDIVQAGRVRAGVAALWCSETGDIWNDNRPPFSAGKRSLYIAIRHQQLPLDIVVEEDARSGTLRDYRVLYLTDQHVSRAASKSIADWVAAGGRLFATARAGTLDELDQPNQVLMNLMGIEAAPSGTPADENIVFEKQDLPFAAPLETVRWKRGEALTVMPAYGAVGRFRAKDAEVQATFADGSPAVAVKKVGTGVAMHCGFLPGLTYFKPAIPLRPVDRGSKPDSMSHFLPTNFERGAAALVDSIAGDVARPIDCSQPLVESTMIVAPQGVVIPLVNWSAGPVKGLQVTVDGDLPNRAVVLASGQPVASKRVAGKNRFTLDLDVADAIILRK